MAVAYYIFLVSSSRWRHPQGPLLSIVYLPSHWLSIADIYPFSRSTQVTMLSVPAFMWAIPSHQTGGAAGCGLFSAAQDRRRRMAGKPHRPSVGQGDDKEFVLPPQFEDGDDDSSWSSGDDNGRDDAALGAEADAAPPVDFSWDDHGPLAEVTKQNVRLLEQLEEKKRQVKELSIIMEAIEPVPGLNAERFLELLRSGAIGENADYRDRKIVQLAKKAREMSVALTHTTARYTQALKDLEQTRRALTKAQDDCNAASSWGAERQEAKNACMSHSSPLGGNNGGGKAMKRANKDADSTEPVSSRRDTELAGLQKQLTELRMKLEKSQEESKALRRALLKEVGQGPAGLEKALEGGGNGWKGRAQQIVMLKAKVKRLEDLLPDRSGENEKSEVSTATSGASRPSDVDRKAQEDIQAIQRERRIKAVEVAESERQRWEAEMAATKRKLEAARARTTYLEADGTRMKEQIKFLLGRAQTDHELIEELKTELVKLGRETSRTSKQPLAPRALKLTANSHKSEERKAMEASLNMDEQDLGLMYAASGPQETPEDVIRRLRRSMKQSS